MEVTIMLVEYIAANLDEIAKETPRKTAVICSGINSPQRACLSSGWRSGMILASGFKPQVCMREATPGFKPGADQSSIIFSPPLSIL